MNLGASSADTTPIFVGAFICTFDGVTSLIKQINLVLEAQGLADDVLSSVQLVLAETLNNIVEHACVNTLESEARVSLRLSGRLLTICTVDGGIEMPGGQAPAGVLPVTSANSAQTAEGGFGWHLIRSLADGVTYTREDGENHLDIRMSVLS